MPKSQKLYLREGIIKYLFAKYQFARHSYPILHPFNFFQTHSFFLIPSLFKPPFPQFSNSHSIIFLHYLNSNNIYHKLPVLYTANIFQYILNSNIPLIFTRINSKNFLYLQRQIIYLATKRCLKSKYERCLLKQIQSKDTIL